MALEIRIAEVSLVAKLDALGAALLAVREAHRAEISADAWAAIERAREEIAAAMLVAIRTGALPLSQGGDDHAADAESGLIQHAQGPAPIFPHSGRRAACLPCA